MEVGQVGILATTLVQRIGGLPARSTPVIISSHIDKELEYTVHFPPGHSLTSAFEKPSVKGPFGSASRVVTSDAEKIVIHIQSSLDANRIPVSEYAEFLDFARDLDQITTVQVRLENAP